MQPTDILYPVFVLVGLTFYLQFWMGRERLSAIERGEVKSSDIALGQRVWPARATQVANAYHNQFELPVLFYALVACALIMSRVDLALVILAWVFVALRLWHAQIHTTHNTVRQRFMVFLAGSAVLLVMWLYFALSVMTTKILL
jgi:hypothetical protein